MPQRTVAVVPHTHWDREWYSPFQTFRLRLVDLLDELLPRLEADPSLSHFLLDGQMALVDDYLAVRPEAEERLRRLAASGRVAMGPWYTLPDEFLVSGETLVRNLQRGLQRAAAFGGAMAVGYLPDMFGHVAQMPQLLRQAELDQAVVWRGVPAAVDRTAFWWEAPDGSRVRAQYLWTAGYGNGAYLPDDAGELVGRIRAWEQDLGPALVGDLLWMYGTDHQVPRPHLGRVVAEANDLQDDYHLEITSLSAFLDAAPTDGLATWVGELRSGARANLLMGVISNRVDVKQAAARAERAVEQLAEPLCALFLPADRWPERLLDEAWLQLLRNSAHDSICACSADDVVEAVLHRYAEAVHIAQGLTERALRALGESLATEGPVVVNPSPRARSGLVELDLPGDVEAEGTQPLVADPQVPGDLRLTGAELPPYLNLLRSQQLDAHTYVNAIDVDDRGDEVEVVLSADRHLLENLIVSDVKADLLAKAQARPDAHFHIRVTRPPRRRVLARMDDLPAYGWAAWTPAPLSVVPVAASRTTMANGLVTVEVDPDRGTFAIDGLPGFGHLVDDGDHGDTYSWSPPEHDLLVDEPEDVQVHVADAGPLLARLVVDRRYTWPERVRARRRVGERTVDVRTTLELRAGERLVRMTVAFDNPSRDHRLRAWLPLPRPATTSSAECAFAVVERGLTAEGGPSETGIPTFPSRRFVQAGGLTVVHEGLDEYELVDVHDGAAHALALTLLRATGMLSRVEVATRPLPAGPPMRVEGPQLLGHREVHLAVQVGDVDPYALVDQAYLPLQVAVGRGTGTRPATGQALDLRGARVSSVVRTAGGLEVRLFNPTAEPTWVDLGGHRGWLVDLRGAPVGPVEGGFGLAPWRIATVRLPG
ncbi:MAG: alpha-mannosidase [Acidimicrobiales bacterium]|nr:alpha-mannosidase [Acidimicrobiales bacterium]